MKPMEKKVIPLSESDKKSPVSKFFRDMLATPNPIPLKVLLDGPMDPKKALYPEDAAKELIKPGYLEVENGYCTMENGCGYVAVNNTFPGCTIEMMKWWMAWHSLEQIRYKIWNPFCHYSIAVSDKDKAYITDPNVPLDKKSQNVRHFVIEDIGGGEQNIMIHFLTPGDLGFDEQELEEAHATVFGGYGIVSDRSGPVNKAPSIMMHYCREIDGGVEFRTRFWMGYRINQGKMMCVLPPHVKIPEFVPMGLALHNVEEYSNLADILPKVYAEFGHLPIQ